MSTRAPVLAAAAVAAVASIGLAGCTLDPLVDDDPAVSLHVLPPGSEVPSVAEDSELVYQILVHDGLDDAPLVEAGGVVAPKVGFAGGAQIAYWSFGNAPKIGAQLYVLMERGGGAPRRVSFHPYLVDTMPGDAAYSPFRRIQHVFVTDLYDGELITTMRALTDAVELGLVEPPVTTQTWMNAPMVAPGTTLEVGRPAPEEPFDVYAGGYRVPMFVFGGDRGVQPLRSGAIPIGQASQLREDGAVRLGDKPIFQFGIPAEPPTEAYNYTALVNLVEVNLAPGVTAASLMGDGDLFMRSMTGGISAMTPAVDSFEVTETVRNWPTQFVEGEP
jgi:hypothetical protein